MPLGIKLFFTLACAVIGAWICFAKSNGNVAGEDRLWRGGKNDPFRTMLYRVDGSMRSYVKVWILVGFALFLVALWFFVPTV